MSCGESDGTDVFRFIPAGGSTKLRSVKNCLKPQEDVDRLHSEEEENKGVRLGTSDSHEAQRELNLFAVFVFARKFVLVNCVSFALAAIIKCLL